MNEKKRFIKNGVLLVKAGLVTDHQLEILGDAAKFHLINGIEFKIVSAAKDQVIIQVKQSKNSTGNYFPAKRLIEITHELFDRYLKGIKMNVGPVVYKIPDSHSVTPDWIEKKMMKLKIGQKDLVRDLGIDKSNISNYLSGSKPMSDIIKTVMYYYFMYRELAG